MKTSSKIERGHYTDVEYRQCSMSRPLELIRLTAGIVTWPVTAPLGLLCRGSEMLFRTVSEMLSLIPYLFGVVIRAEFYRFALRHCGRNVVIEFGTVFIYPEISIGDNVTIGRYSVIHHCDIGNYVLVGEKSSLLSGSRQHNYDRLDVPMALRGKKKRIALGDDCWIGANAVVMEEVGHGAIVGAGSVVTKPVPPYAIVVGNPARTVRSRRQSAVDEVAFIDSSRPRVRSESRRN